VDQFLKRAAKKLHRSGGKINVKVQLPRPEQHHNGGHHLRRDGSALGGVDAVFTAATLNAAMRKKGRKRNILPSPSTNSTSTTSTSTSNTRKAPAGEEPNADAEAIRVQRGVGGGGTSFKSQLQMLLQICFPSLSCTESMHLVFQSLLLTTRVGLNIKLAEVGSCGLKRMAEKAWDKIFWQRSR
jgi:hypothetical protein